MTNTIDFTKLQMRDTHTAYYRGDDEDYEFIFEIGQPDQRHTNQKIEELARELLSLRLTNNWDGIKSFKESCKKTLGIRVTTYILSDPPVKKPSAAEIEKTRALFQRSWAYE